MQITFDKMTGYATYAFAKKRGEAVAAEAEIYAGPRNAYKVRWLVIAREDGRFVPAFNVNEFPGGPGFFLGKTNVACFN